MVAVLIQKDILLVFALEGRCVQVLFGSLFIPDVLKLNQSVVEYVQSQKMFSVNQLVNRLSVQWQIGSMIPYAEFQGK